MLQSLSEKTYRVLRWSEKYTRTDMVYLAKNGGWMMADRAVSMLAAFLLSIALANLLPKDVFGNYKYVISVIGILSLSTLSGMSTAQARASAKGNDGDLKDGVRAEMKWGILGSLTSLGLGVLYYAQHNLVLALAFGVVAFCLPFFNVYSLYAAVLQGKKLFGLSVIYDIWSQAAYFCLMLPAVFQTRQVWTLILPFIFINSGLQYVFYRDTLRKVPMSASREPGTISYGKVLSLIAVINTVADSADQIITFNFLGPVQLAVYNMALAPTEQMRGVFKTIMPLALPKFAAEDKTTLKKAIAWKTLRFALLIAFLVGVYIVLARWFYAILFPKYMDSVFFSQLLAISLIAVSSYLPNIALQAQKEEASFIKVSIWTSLFQIVTLLLGGFFWGLLGIVMAKIFTRFFGLGLNLYLARRPRGRQA